MKSEHTGQNIWNYIQNMLCNKKSTLDRVSVFFFARQRKKFQKGNFIVKTSSVSFFIHTLQLVIKDSLFKDDRIKLLLAKIRKLFAISGILKPTEMLKTNPVKLCPRINETKSQGYKVELNKSYARESE